MKEQMAASAHTVKNVYLLWAKPILRPNIPNWLNVGVFPKTKKDPNYIFRTALPRYGGNAKMDTVFEHQFEKWYFAGDAHIVIEGV